MARTPKGKWHCWACRREYEAEKADARRGDEDWEPNGVREIPPWGGVDDFLGIDGPDREAYRRYKGWA